MDTFTLTLNPKNPHYSVTIMGQLRKSPMYIKTPYPEVNESKLKGLSYLLELLDQLSWEEHTSDWDPYLNITTKDKTFSTNSGYYHFDIKGTNIIFHDTDWDTDEEITHEFPIEDILQINIIN